MVKILVQISSGRRLSPYRFLYKDIRKIRYCAVVPPSMTNSEPVTKEDSSEAR